MKKPMTRKRPLPNSPSMRTGLPGPRPGWPHSTRPMCPAGAHAPQCLRPHRKKPPRRIRKLPLFRARRTRRSICSVTLSDTINIPRQSRGFFICGHSPRILARASRRASTVCQPRKSRYLPPVNGHFRSLAWSAALLLCPARTDIGCTPVSSLHFSPPCPHSTHGTRIPGSGISIFAPGTSRTASGCFFLSATP